MFSGMINDRMLPPTLLGAQQGIVQKPQVASATPPIATGTGFGAPMAVGQSGSPVQTVGGNDPVHGPEVYRPQVVQQHLPPHLQRGGRDMGEHGMPWNQRFQQR